MSIFNNQLLYLYFLHFYWQSSVGGVINILLVNGSLLKNIEINNRKSLVSRLGFLDTNLLNFTNKLPTTISKSYFQMWPILLQMLRSNVAYITLPIAAVVGVIGYNLESLLSDKYTPYSSKYLPTDL